MDNCSRNGEKYIHAQILSILRQTEPDVSLLISDDASADRTPAIAADYAELYPDRVTFLRRKEPSGSAAKHFMTVLHDRADEDSYVCFADQDDVWHPDKMEKTLAAMKKAEKRYGTHTPLIVHCDMRVTDGAGAELQLCMIERLDAREGLAHASHLQYEFRHGVTPPFFTG